jgi:hypothetical protein
MLQPYAGWAVTPQAAQEITQTVFTRCAQKAAAQ